MARDTMFDRFQNGKINMHYLTLDAQLLDVMTKIFKNDPSRIGKIIIAFNEYERTGGESVPDLGDDAEQSFLIALIEKHEFCRSALQKRSEAKKASSNAKKEKPAELLE